MEVRRLIEISLLTGELFFTVLWLLIRGMIWIQQKKIAWKREAFLLLMFINLAVLIRFVFYPFFTVNGKVQPLIIYMDSIQPLRVNLIPLVNILDYDIKREAAINIIGNISMFIPTGIIMPILYKRLDRFWKVLLAGAGLSLMIEMIQLLFPGSVTDIDDLILNAGGVAIGYGIYKLAVRHRGRALFLLIKLKRFRQIGICRICMQIPCNQQCGYIRLCSYNMMIQLSAEKGAYENGR